MRNMKAILIALLLGCTLLTTGCSTTSEDGTDAPDVKDPAAEDTLQETEEETEEQRELTPAEKVLSMEGNLDTEVEIESLWVAYCAMSDEEKAEFPAERLMELREEVADCYARTDRKGSNIDRSKILLGSYPLKFADEQHIQEIVEAGLDFMGGVPTDKETLDLLLKYGIGAFPNARSYGFSYWHGEWRDPEIGKIEPTVSPEEFAASLTNDIKHDAIWGVNISDEPSQLDFWYFEELREAFDKFYPEYVGYINLLPCHARTECKGTTDYEEYIDNYINTINTDYICYDHYMCDDPGMVYLVSALENLRVVGNACRENDREMWIWLQANSGGEGKFLPLDHLRVQANTALAYGTTGIIWACWNNGWWYNNAYDAEGNKTETYNLIKDVNAEINMLSPTIIKYKSLGTSFLGYVADEYYFLDGLEALSQKEGNNVEQSVLTEMKTGDEKDTILCGWFEKKIGTGNAMMFVNLTDKLCRKKPVSQVTFKAPEGAVITLHTKEGSRVLTPVDGVYTIEILNAEYAFVTVD